MSKFAEKAGPILSLEDIANVLRIEINKNNYQGIQMTSYF